MKFNEQYTKKNRNIELTHAMLRHLIVASYLRMFLLIKNHEIGYIIGSVQLKKKFAQCLLSKDKKVKIV